LATSKPKYSEIVKSEKTLTKDAEAILKEAIAEYKKTFLASV
jgi:F-type H+/Na+-transporting ATPase subunit alpha